MINAQETNTCKVLLTEISGSYEGECKKGLADGFGKATGVDQYEGELKKRLPEREGEIYLEKW
ncbi:MAG: hypothetical protein AB2L24_14000 [Mangrovibacterium sp.]